MAAEVRKVLQYPAVGLRAGLEASVEQLSRSREETGKVRAESEVARRYFGNLVRDSREGKVGVESVDLEGGQPGVAAGIEPGVMI